ncbi:MAG: potassium transporter [Aquificae bacterium]|nr:potassium transporter [Aquificota bacterium]
MVRELNPARTLLFSFTFTILVGSLLLYLPLSSIRPISYLEALFTATSAVTVTGLTVIDPYADLTLFGKFILLLLIQVGGLGYMTLSTFFLIVLRRRIGLKERFILAESLEYPSLHGLVRFLRRVMAFVLSVELAGGLILSTHFALIGVEDPLFNGFFHAVSAFNNAGFSTLREGLAEFKSDPVVNLVIAFLVVLGGLGFFVVNDLYLYFTGRVRRLSVHTYLVLYFSLFLIAAGTLGLLFTEWGNEKGLWGESWYGRVLGAFFLSVSSRTAGFSTLDLAQLSESSQFLLMMLMFVGASPGGTGGGIKTTTFLVVLIAVFSFVRGREQTVVLNRSISERQVKRALVIMSLSVFFVTFVNLLLDKIENKDFLYTLFEVVSAFSTVGLSIGTEGGLSFCSEFSALGKVLIMITMLAGRVGILSFALALTGRGRPQHLRYPEAKILL